MRRSLKGTGGNRRINPFHRDVHVLSTRTLIICGSIILAGVFGVIVAGCNREAKHKILTFFFEGVPPLDSEKIAVETEMTMAVDESPQPVVAGKKIISRVLKQRRASKHESVSDCGKCHLGGMGMGQQQLVEPLPDLCYSCHANFEALGDFLHGPISVGNCVFCHDAHQSRYVHLQKAPQPGLCYLCHGREDMSDIADHQDREEIICTDCHDPHAGSTRMRLKPFEEPKGDPNIIDLSK
jgi:predicted CXXCH cytochrome family protein